LVKKRKDRLECFSSFGTFAAGVQRVTIYVIVKCHSEYTEDVSLINKLFSKNIHNGFSTKLTSTSKMLSSVRNIAGFGSSSVESILARLSASLCYDVFPFINIVCHVVLYIDKAPSYITLFTLYPSELSNFLKHTYYKALTLSVREPHLCLCKQVGSRPAAE